MLPLGRMPLQTSDFCVVSKKAVCYNGYENERFRVNDMGITLQQIADLAGVHKSTVDKVIHNRPGVSDAKRQMIRKLLEEHGYESNPLAKALNYQKNKFTAAVVLPSVDAAPALKVGTELLQQDFRSFNIEVQYYEPGNAAEEAECLRALCGQNVAGVVVNPIEDHAVADALKKLSDAHIPVITVNSDINESARLCFVGQDMEQSGKTAARLIGLLLDGNGEVGIISSRAMHAVIQRRHAFESYLPECSPEVRIAEAVDIQEQPEYAYQQTAALLERNPSLHALFITCGCVPDVCRAVRDKGLAGKLKIICYERYPAITELVESGEISCTISGELEEQGRLAMRLLFEYMIYDHIPEQDQVYTKNEILFRENI